MAEVLSAPPADEADGNEGEDDSQGAAGVEAQAETRHSSSDAERGEATPDAEEADADTNEATASFSSVLGGAQQRLAPHFLNMCRLRQAILPGASMHASARALAAFYDAFGGGRVLLPLSAVTKLVSANSGGTNEARWVAGFMLGECIDGSGRKCTVLGHSAPGGTLGLCIPAMDIALAITVSKLSPSRAATKRIVELTLGEYGIRVSQSNMPGLLSDD